MPLKGRAVLAAKTGQQSRNKMWKQQAERERERERERWNSRWKLNGKRE